MHDSARERILMRVRTALADAPKVNRPAAVVPAARPASENIARLAELLEAVQTEVYITPSADWLSKLTQILQEKNIKTLLYGPKTALAAELETLRRQAPHAGPQLRAYADEMETFKDALFSMDAGITTTLGAVADRGALILWPTVDEPRLISLVPPVHIAVLDADRIYGSLSEAIERQHWAAGMPTNALLVSGPSKTADIEFTLIYGVHGPKELVVLIRQP